MLILALDLEEVEEVCSAGADFNEIFRWMRSWGREGGYEEVLWSGDILGHLNAFHP